MAKQIRLHYDGTAFGGYLFGRLKDAGLDPQHLDHDALPVFGRCWLRMAEWHLFQFCFGCEVDQEYQSTADRYCQDPICRAELRCTRSDRPMKAYLVDPSKCIFIETSSPSDNCNQLEQGNKKRL